MLLKAQGRLEEAAPLYREALDARRAMLGDRHPHTLTAIGNLGSTLKSMGETLEALMLLRELGDAWLDVHGSEPPRALLDDINSLQSLQ